MVQLSDSHKKRIVTGLILAVALAACLFFAGWPLRLLVSLAALLGLWEFYQLVWPGYTALADKVVGYAAALLICLGGGFGYGASFQFAVCGAVAALVALKFLLRFGFGDDEAKVGDSSLLLFGIFYVPLSLQLALHLSLAEQVVVILGALGSDVGAYYAGSLFGKHKIWPTVSPKKSWEGALGGALGAMLLVAFFSLPASIAPLDHLAFWQWGAIGFALSIAGQLGDFFESALKRSAGIKDSSNLLPGHGGVLDRIDSVLFALPLYMLIRAICLASATVPEAAAALG